MLWEAIVEGRSLLLSSTSFPNAVIWIDAFNRLLEGNINEICVLSLEYSLGLFLELCAPRLEAAGSVIEGGVHSSARKHFFRSCRRAFATLLAMQPAIHQAFLAQGRRPFISQSTTTISPLASIDLQIPTSWFHDSLLQQQAEMEEDAALQASWVDRESRD
jgi:hypothetical protein